MVEPQIMNLKTKQNLSKIQGKVHMFMIMITVSLQIMKIKALIVFSIFHLINLLVTIIKFYLKPLSEF